MKTIRGLSAFPITPADAAGRVDTDALQTLLARLVAAGVDSIGLLGSTGSYPYFTRAERRRTIAAAADTMRGRTPLLVGVGALRTDAAVELARDAKAEGADAGLLAPVSYAPLLDDEVFELFRAVAAVGLPLCIYNNPSTTHFSFSPALVGRIAQLDNVVAVKSGAPAAADAKPAVDDLRARVPAGFAVGFSVDWNAAATLLAGGDAWFSVLAGIYPATCVRITRAAMAGDRATVQQLDQRLTPLWALFRAHTSYRVVHFAAAMAGIAHAEPPRPVLPLRGDAAAEVERVLRDLALD